MPASSLYSFSTPHFRCWASRCHGWVLWTYYTPSYHVDSYFNFAYGWRVPWLPQLPRRKTAMTQEVEAARHEFRDAWHATLLPLVITHGSCIFKLLAGQWSRYSLVYNIAFIWRESERAKSELFKHYLWRCQATPRRVDFSLYDMSPPLLDIILLSLLILSFPTLTLNRNGLLVW